MKQIFLWLLKLYTKTEKERLEVFSVLHEQVRNEYNEQTPFGNVYNAHTEFCMSQPLIKTLVNGFDFPTEQKFEFI